MPLTRIDVTDHVATVSFEPPAGGYDRALLDAIGTAAEEVGAREDVRAVILRSEGEFGSGWAGSALEEPLGIPGIPHVAAGIDAVAAIPQPVVAAIRGRAHSIALELALACDVRVADEDATFALADTAAGAVPIGGGTQRLPRAVGRAEALRLILLGEEIDAAEALRIGLVSRVVLSEELDSAAQAIADAVASRGPIATRLAKEAVHRGVEMPLDQALRYELDLTVLLQSTADRAEGVRAFAEKRPPRFIGR
ncbi:MAG: enoyl-CoA hydratase/isomerase family protein [Dehalococcoidia bacterium]